MLMRAFKKKHFILSCCCVLLLNFQSPHDRIIWSKDVKLIWDDFKGTSINIQGKKSNRIVEAISYTGIYCTLDYNSNEEKYYIEIYSYFDKTKSWVKNKETGLLHEQGHFDIREIYARKLRRIMKRKRFSKDRISIKIEEIEKEIFKQCKEYQDLYDSETDFDNDIKKQKEWELKIQKELNDLDKYTETKFSVKTFGKGL